MDSKQLARKLAKLALSKKATDIKILDLRNITTITDFFVICSGSSDPQVKAIADSVIDGSKKLGERPWHKEGISNRNWVLLDFVNVVMHIFQPETRNFYGLEKLWGDADMEVIKD